MGDRILFQVTDGKKVSPVIYGHWCGSDAPDLCARLSKQMKGRSGDVDYTAARCVQQVIGEDKGNLGVGIWSADKLLTEDDSHGDAGIVIIDCSGPDLTFSCMGGYLKSDGGRAPLVSR